MSRWIEPRPQYYVQTGGMHENPFGVPRDEIVRFILHNPAEVVAQVVFGKYVESSGLVFTSEVIQRMFERNRQPITGNFWLSKTDAERARILVPRLDYGSPYHTGVDLARQTDWTVITTIDTTAVGPDNPGRVVEFKRLQRVPWETIYTEIGKSVALWGPNVLFDGTGPGGDVVHDALESRFFCTRHQQTILVNSRCLKEDGSSMDCDADEDYISLACCEPFHFSASTKKELVEHLRNVMSIGYRQDGPAKFGLLRCPPIAQLEEELTFYTWDDKKLVTDCLFSLALAAWSGLEDPAQDPDYGSVHGS